MAATDAFPPRYVREDFASPELTCDMVMKGGITSGVVYPYAITELARKYRFKSVGGSSAGAIAAALAAAAELGRESESGGFPALSELPDELGRDLAGLFQPAAATRPAFEVALGLVGKRSNFGKAAAAVRAIAIGHPVAILVGAIVGALAAGAGVAAVGGRFAAVALAWLALCAVAGGAAGGLGRFVVALWRALPNNGYGLCNGSAGAGRHRGPALTPWLADLLDRVAGKKDPSAPLTFGDLWGEDHEGAESDPSRRAINLEMMTSSLTNGRPYRLPFETRVFHWRRDEFEQLFPARILDWMQGRSEAVDGVPGLFKLPAPADLPVVVAVRMSLSFPILLSAVPLHAVDWSRPSNWAAKEAKKAPLYERCWFSDGGLGSNFPVHFFDALLPGRPTFGINLRPFPVEFSRESDECRNVRFPTEPGQEVLPDWRRFDGPCGFVGAIVHLMQNWVDSQQTRLPGYRDRVVHIHFTEVEGGLNLAMDADQVAALTERGWCAGRELATSFDWDLHRWVRFRSTMAELQRGLGLVARTFRPDAKGESYPAFLERYASVARSYKLARPDEARERAVELIALVESWPEKLYRSTAPRPEPDLRVVPRT